MVRAWWKRYHELAAAYRPHRPEATFKGTVLCLLRHHFKQRRHWMIVAEALLREIAAEQTPDTALLLNIDDSGSEEEASSESEDDDDDDDDDDDNDDNDEAGRTATHSIIQRGIMEDLPSADTTVEEADELMSEAENLANVSLDSQGNEIKKDRRKALRPDFSVSKSQAILFRNQTHLWVEVKNGSQPSKVYTKQLRDYIWRIAAAIPTGFLEVHPDVVLMLIDASRTYYWRITPDIVNIHAKEEIWDWALQDVTFGPSMTAVLNELSRRPGIDVAL